MRAALAHCSPNMTADVRKRTLSDYTLETS